MNTTHEANCICDDCWRPANDTTNYDQPHLVTHESKFYNESERRRHTITAFLCVYVVSRQYGGPQEGGWYFDGYEFTGAAFPFRCEQEFEARELDESEQVQAATGDLSYQHWYDDETEKYMAWVPVGLPHVTDEPTRVRLDSARMHFIDVYGDPDANEQRYSVLSGSRGVDVAFIYELQPGERGERPRPSYC